MLPRRFLIPNAVATRYAHLVMEFGFNSGIEISISEARQDLLQRLSLIASPLTITNDVAVYCDASAHPMRFIYNFEISRSSQVLRDFVMEMHDGFESIKISDHAWERFGERLAEIGIQPAEDEARKEMIRCLLRGSWRIEEAKVHTRTYHCFDASCRWGGFQFKLAQDEFGFRNQLSLVTCHLAGAKERRKHRSYQQATEVVVHEFRNEFRDPDKRKNRKTRLRLNRVKGKRRSFDSDDDLEFFDQ